MRAVEHEARARVIEAAQAPVARVVAALARRAEARLVPVVLLVAPDALARRVERVLDDEVAHQAARMRPGCLVVDDVRGGEAADVLTLLGSRAGGDLVGVHCAISGADGLAALRTLLQVGGVRDDAASGVIASAAHVLVCVDHTEKGRKVVRVSEVRGGRGQGQLEVKDLYVYDGGFRQA